MTEQRRSKLKYRLQQSRMRLGLKDDSFGELLYGVMFVAVKGLGRISTNGHCIYFDPDWLGSLGDNELDFMIAHQLMHILLGHIDRPKFFAGDRYHLACDIIVNSRLEKYGWTKEYLPRVGKIHTHTFFPPKKGDTLTVEEAFSYIPFDPAALKNGHRRNYMIDSEQGWDMTADRGQCGTVVLRPEDGDPELQVNEPEENDCKLYHVVRLEFGKEEAAVDGQGSVEIPQNPPTAESNKPPDPDRLVEREVNRLRQQRANDTAASDLASCDRMWRKRNAATVNWRTLLNSFIQQETCDYSFTPPDRRFGDLDIFLPDFNVTSEKVEDILFMVDTSASVGDETLSAVYGEIGSALSFLNGGLNGMLGFFDTRVHGLCNISTVDELAAITPHGNGATSFKCIFEHIKTKMPTAPACVVVFTDGAADFPDPKAAGNIPALWLLTDRRVEPPWGSFAYVTV